MLLFLTLGLAAFVWCAGRVNFARAAAIGIVTLSVAWLGYSLAGKPYFLEVVKPAKELGAIALCFGEQTVDRVLPRPSAPQPACSLALRVPALRNRRVGFEHTGGGTNIVTWSVDDAALDLSQAAHARAALMGLAMLFVPISTLKATGLAQFDGGRGLLVVTDVDTLVADACLFAVAGLLLVHRKKIRGNVPYLLFALGLGCFTCLLLSYIVTNFGTLVRLRPLAFAPLWMLPLAVHDRITAPGELTGWLFGRFAATLTRLRVALS